VAGCSVPSSASTARGLIVVKVYFKRAEALKLKVGALGLDAGARGG